MPEQTPLSDCFDPDSPRWIESAIAHQRYNISEKKLRKWEGKYVGGMHCYDTIKYWEPDIQRMLECIRTGQKFTESELVPIFESQSPTGKLVILTNKPLLLHTLCLLFCWATVPEIGLYAAWLKWWNITILVLGIRNIINSTRIVDAVHSWLFEKWEELMKRFG